MGLTAFFIGLIRRVPAVCSSVAHFLHADTLPCFTLEHGGAFTGCHCTEGRGGNVSVQTQQEGNLEVERAREKPLTSVASELIAEVSAVMHPIALESASNAGAVEALELILSAGGTSCNKKGKQI